MTFIIMLSFNAFGSELSTLGTYVKHGKSLSPTFYEDVMKNIKKVHATCKTAVLEKTKNLSRLNGTVQTLKSYDYAKSNIINTPLAISGNLTSQIEKIQGAKKEYQSTPVCAIEKLGLLFPGYLKSLNKLLGPYSVNYQFDYAINYLSQVRNDIDKISNLPANKVTQDEIQIYQGCTKKLGAVLKEFEYENL